MMIMMKNKKKMMKKMKKKKMNFLKNSLNNDKRFSAKAQLLYNGCIPRNATLNFFIIYK